MRSRNITAMSGVNTLFNALVHRPNLPRLDFSTLRFAIGGGAAVQSDVAQPLARDHRQRIWSKVTG